MGCIEKHGLHLPLGTDITKGSMITYMASQIETACVFPDFTFGDVPAGKHTKRPDGTICIDVTLQMTLLETLCDEIAANGFEKILVVNSHGGNVKWLDTFSRNLGVRPHDFVFAHIKAPLVAPHVMAEILIDKGRGSIPELTAEDEDLILKYHEEGMKGGHACMGETAHMMGFAPESVHLDRLGIESGLAQPNPIKPLMDAGINVASGGWGFLYPNWYSGHDPVGCNERIGKASLRIAAEHVARGIKLYKEDEFLVKWHKSRRVDEPPRG